MKRLTAVMSAVLVLAGAPASTPSQDREVSTGPHEWRLKLRLDDTNLPQPAIQYILVEEDPRPGFREVLKRLGRLVRVQLDEAESVEEKRDVRNGQLAYAWEHAPFGEVPGTHVRLLHSADFGGVHHGVPKGFQGDTDRRWIVSKVVLTDDGNIAWALPVELPLGRVTEITLSRANALDLESVLPDSLRH